MLRCLLALPLLLAPLATASAADQNGYTAEYECRAGGPRCNVDVAALGNRACNQVISPSTPWSSINWSNNTICLQAGDHTSKGTLTIPSSASGAAGQYKVLRYSNSADDNKDPWKQSASEQARLAKVAVDGSHWIIHRLALPSIDSPLGQRIYISGVSRDVIVNRVLVEGMSSGFANSYMGIYVECCGAAGITIQNSVVRNSWGKVGSEPHGITALDGDNIRIVNNEVYDWSAHPIQMGRNGGTADMAGFVVENNDLYQSSRMHLANGKARAKNTLSLKAGGVPANPGKVINNRMWGARKSDTAVCCISSDAGAGGYFSNAHDYVLIQNNIFADSQLGFAFYNGQQHHISLIGNIFSGMRQFDATGRSHAIETVGNALDTEFYLNSFIDNSDYGLSFGGGSIDVRCNAFIAGGVRQGGIPGSDTTADHNAFYGTPSWSFNGTDAKKDLPLSLRANSTHYAAGHILRWGSTGNCGSEADGDCFLYRVLNAGSTAASAPPPCTTLGCTFVDGNITVQAIRGPYAFYRKLRTAPERRIVPYARVHSDADEAYACPVNYSARQGMGVDD